TYLSLYVQNTLGYSPVQAGLRFLPLSLASFAVALVTGRLIGKVAMRVLLGVAMVAAAAGLASMAHLTATSTWLVLLPGFILAGIGLGVASTVVVPPAARPAVTHAARAGTASGLNDVLLAAAAFAVLGAIFGFAYGPDPARQPPPSPASGELSAQPAPAQHQAQRPAGPETTRHL